MSKGVPGTPYLSSGDTIRQLEGFLFAGVAGSPDLARRLFFGPGFCCLRIRPKSCSSDARNASSHSGRLVRSWARGSFTSSSGIALARKLKPRNWVGRRSGSTLPALGAQGRPGRLGDPQGDAAELHEAARRTAGPRVELPRSQTRQRHFQADSAWCEPALSGRQGRRD